MNETLIPKNIRVDKELDESARANINKFNKETGANVSLSYIYRVGFSKEYKEFCKRFGLK